MTTLQLLFVPWPVPLLVGAILGLGVWRSAVGKELAAWIALTLLAAALALVGFIYVRTNASPVAELGYGITYAIALLPTVLICVVVGRRVKRHSESVVNVILTTAVVGLLSTPSFTFLGLTVGCALTRDCL